MKTYAWRVNTMVVVTVVMMMVVMLLLNLVMRNRPITVRV
jgi:hypothetical protein